MPLLKTLLNFSCYVLLLASSSTVTAQDKSDHYGGLGDFPVLSGEGGPQEFNYCVIYARRAWRVANMIEERAISATQAKSWARQELGKKAASEEIEDFERLEKKEYSSPHSMAGERFFRCATQLRLNPETRHKSNAEFCFKSISLLDYVARGRADGRTREQTRAAVNKNYRSVSPDFLNSTIERAFSGPPISEGSTLIEDVFSSCFAEAGERQLKGQR